ncbi:hypothetical protein JQC92_18950 [Shewanella sp. 202IG2-18]|uniref:hypothetical protein n=1 Tax=Parashewanella hymeniacidonis TaxID=2807618 RepID=UPI00195F94D2|nr:hypothetical protein [Parashewanella hymeniacidonis]MBM7074085.1 hypothetical protein [Parashewanella hymeniacidonis]
MSSFKVPERQLEAQNSLVEHLADGENLSDGTIISFCDREFKISHTDIKDTKDGVAVWSANKKNYGLFDRFKSFMMSAFGFDRKEDYVNNMFECDAVQTILQQYKWHQTVGNREDAKFLANNLKEFFKTSYWVKNCKLIYRDG